MSVLVLFALGGRADASEAAAQPTIQRGVPLDQALRALEAEGLTIAFSAELVLPDMEVLATPSSVEPEAVLEEILAPHGLRTRETRGVLVVVSAGGPEGRSVAGTVTGDGRPLAGAGVRLAGEGGDHTTSSGDGSWALGPLEPGRYVLEISAEGFLTERPELNLGAARTALRFDVELQRQPFVHEEIVVRPSRLSLLLEEPNTSFSLGREEIDSLPQLGGDLFRTASLFPGVTSNDVSAQFSVHGGRRDEVRVVLDGQELYDAYHLKDYDSALSLVPARTLADASLTTGSYPVHHGDRMSAVLDLRTVDPPSGQRFVVGLSVLDLLLSGSGRFAQDHAGWLFTARRGSLDLAGRAIGDERPKYWDLQGKLRWATRRGSWSGHFLASNDELEVDITEEEGFEVFENGYENTYFWINQHTTLGRRLLLQTVASRARIRRTRGGAAREEEGGFELRDLRDLEVLALSQDWTLDAGKDQTPQWGLEVRRYDVSFDYSKDFEPEFLIEAPYAPGRAIVHAFDDELRGDHVALWASDRFSLFERLTAEIGLRYDRHDLTDDSLWSPRLNLAWRVGQRTVVRGAWGVFHQTQRPYELQVEDGESTLARAERSEHWLLGTESLLRPNRLGLEALRVEIYRREIENPRTRYESLLEPLNFFPEIEPDRVRIEPERAGSEGIELLLRGGAGRRIAWWAAYSRANVEDRLGGEEVPRSLDQRHTLTLDVNYRWKDWNLNAAWRYHSGWPTTPVAARLEADPEEPDAEPELVPFFGPLNSERLPAYHRLDLRLSRTWQRPWGLWTFFVDVQNVYDRQNLAGFDVKLEEEEGLVLLEEESWPGIFPSFGLTWTFGKAPAGTRASGTPASDG